MDEFFRFVVFFLIFVAAPGALCAFGYLAFADLRKRKGETQAFIMRVDSTGKSYCSHCRSELESYIEEPRIGAEGGGGGNGAVYPDSGRAAGGYGYSIKPKQEQKGGE